MSAGKFLRDLVGAGFKAAPPAPHVPGSALPDPALLAPERRALTPEIPGVSRETPGAPPPAEPPGGPPGGPPPPGSGPPSPGAPAPGSGRPPAGVVDDPTLPVTGPVAPLQEPVPIGSPLANETPRETIVDSVRRQLDAETNNVNPINSLEAAARVRFDPQAPPVGGLGDYLSGKPAQGEVFNWGRIDEAPDVKAYLKDAMEHLRASSDANRRGTVTFAEIDDAVAARMLNTSPTRVREMRALSAEDFREASTVMMDLTLAVKAQAQRAFDTATSSPAELMRLRVLQEEHATIALHVKGLQTETARTLSSMRMAKQAMRESDDVIRQVMDQYGGEGYLRRTAGMLSQIDDPATLSNAILRTQRVTTWDMFLETYTMALLTSPVTQGVNVLTSAATHAYRNVDLVSGYLVNRLRSIFQSGRERMYGEEIVANAIDLTAFQRIFASIGRGDTRATFAALSQNPTVAGGVAGARAFATGTHGDVISRFETTHRAAVTAENVAGLPAVEAVADALGLHAPRWMHAGFDMMAEYVLRAPGKIMLGADEMIKTWSFMAETRRQVAHAGIERGLTGEALKEFAGEALAHPEIYLPGSTMQGARVARYNTFQTEAGPFTGILQHALHWRPGGLGPEASFAERLGRGASDLIVESVQGLVKMHVPFIRTPINIFKYAAEHSPAAAAMPGFWRTVTAGGVESDIAIGKLATGSLITWGLYEHVFSGLVTGGGPIDDKLRARLEETGWQPYSIVVPKDSWVGRLVGLERDRYISYRRADPYAMMLGMVADHADIWGYMTDEEREAGIGGVGVLVLAGWRNMMAKTYLTGLSNLFEVFAHLTKEDNFSAVERHFARQASSPMAPPGLAWLMQNLRDDKRKDPKAESEALFQANRAAGHNVDLFDYIQSFGDQLRARVKARLQSGEAVNDLDLWGNERPIARGALWNLVPFPVKESDIDGDKLASIGLDRLRWTSTRVKNWDQEKWETFLSAVGVNGEFVRLGWSPGNHPEKLVGVQLTPQERHDFIKEINSITPSTPITLKTGGRDFQFSTAGMTLKEATLALMRTEEYRAASDTEGAKETSDRANSKREMIQRLFEVYRFHADAPNLDTGQAGAAGSFAAKNSDFLTRLREVRQGKELMRSRQ